MKALFLGMMLLFFFSLVSSDLMAQGLLVPVTLDTYKVVRQYDEKPISFDVTVTTDKKDSPIVTLSPETQTGLIITYKGLTDVVSSPLNANKFIVVGAKASVILTFSFTRVGSYSVLIGDKTLTILIKPKEIGFLPLIVKKKAVYKDNGIFNEMKTVYFVGAEKEDTFLIKISGGLKTFSYKFTSNGNYCVPVPKKENQYYVTGNVSEFYLTTTPSVSYNGYKNVKLTASFVKGSPSLDSPSILLKNKTFQVVYNGKEIPAQSKIISIVGAQTEPMSKYFSMGSVSKVDSTIAYNVAPDTVIATITSDNRINLEKMQPNSTYIVNAQIDSGKVSVTVPAYFYSPKAFIATGDEVKRATASKKIQASYYEPTRILKPGQLPTFKKLAIKDAKKIKGVSFIDSGIKLTGYINLVDKKALKSATKLSKTQDTTYLGVDSVLLGVPCGITMLQGEKKAETQYQTFAMVPPAILGGLDTGYATTNKKDTSLKFDPCYIVSGNYFGAKPKFSIQYLKNNKLKSVSLGIIKSTYATDKNGKEIKPSATIFILKVPVMDVEATAFTLVVDNRSGYDAVAIDKSIIKLKIKK